MKEKALRQFCLGLFGLSNWIPSDIADVQVENVEREFPQDSAGVRVSFTASWNIIGKTDGPTHEALDVLLPDGDEPGAEK